MMAFLQKLAPLPSSSSFPSRRSHLLLLRRHFQSISPLAFKFKIKIKEQQQYEIKDSSGPERRISTPLVDHGAAPSQATSTTPDPSTDLSTTPDPSTDPSTTPDPSTDPSSTPGRNTDNVYRRNTRKKTASKIATFKKMKTWPLVTATMHMLKDVDLPLGIKVCPT